jgi:hypothetical protein
MRAFAIVLLAGCASWQETQLYFGLDRPGGTVSAAEWQTFVDAEVTRLLPEGFTVVEGQGQWRDGHGAVVREPSRVLLVLHPTTRRYEDAIEELRRVYAQRFQQQSVLRADWCARVRFK